MAQLYRRFPDICAVFSNAETHFGNHPIMPECHQKMADARAEKITGQVANCCNFRENPKIFTIFPGKKYQGHTKTGYMVVSKAIILQAL